MTNQITLTNQIAVALKQSAHANLSTTTCALLAQRIVADCLSDYVRACNSHAQLAEAVKELLATYPITERFEPSTAEELRMANAITDARAALKLAGE